VLARHSLKRVLRLTVMDEEEDEEETESRDAEPDKAL
jgi:hypothetical protein